jgi:hypothetical protein
MTTTFKLKILKIIKIPVLIIFVPILLFYLGIIVPEYLACDKTMFEGQNGVDIWGSEIDCNCESQAFGEAFFQMFSLIIGIFTIILFLAFFFTYKIKKELNPNK